MNDQINFLGLSFEAGQSRKGLRSSPEWARNYFSQFMDSDISLMNHGTIGCDSTGFQLFDSDQLPSYPWQKYELAFYKMSALLASPSPLLNWGGDHSIAVATVAAFLNHYQDGYLVWIDAHADLNLPQASLTGNVHGMPLSILLNLNQIGSKYFPWVSRFLDPQKLIYVGLRDLDPFETMTIERLKIKNFSMNQIRDQGMDWVAKEIQNLVHNNPVHVSFDIDSVCPLIAPSTGVPVQNGLQLPELDLLATSLSQNQNIKSVDIVEINPQIGNDQQVEQTYAVAFRFLKKLILLRRDKCLQF